MADYGLTAGQVALIIKDAADQVKEHEKSMKLAAAQTKAWDELLVHLDKTTFSLAQEHEKQWRTEQLAGAALVNAAILAELDAQVKLNAEWGLNAAGAIAVNVSALDKLNMAMEALHQKKVEGISQSKEEQVLIDGYTKSLLDDALAEDAATQAINKKTTAMEASAKATNTATEALKSFTLAGASSVPDKFKGMTHDQLVGAGIIDIHSNVTMLGQEVGFGYGGVGGTTAHFAEGGTVMVGENGPERVALPTGSTVYPSGSGGGDINVYVTGAFGTMQQVTDAVSKGVYEGSGRKFSRANRG
jgi:hypothetical protein